MDSSDQTIECDGYNLTFAKDNLQRYFEYYETDSGEKRGRCRKCSVTYARPNGGTTKLRKHLETCNLEAYTCLDKSKIKSVSTSSSLRTPKIKEAFKSNQKWSKDNPLSVAMDKHFLKVICLNFEPLNFTEHAGMDLIVDTKYTLKGRFFMTKLLENEFNKETQRLKKKYLNIDFIALTVDGWSSKNQDKHFLSITAHSITPEFTLDFDLIACVPMYDRGTGLNIAKHIEDVCLAFEIPLTKIVAIVRDGAKSMISAANLLGVLSINCFIHKLQLCVRESIEPYKEEIGKAREIARRFNTSSNFHRDFLQRSDKHLIKDVKTRWNSTHDMLKRIDDSRVVLTDLARKEYKTQSGTFNLPDLAYNELSKIVDALQPAADYTKELSNRNAFISNVIPIYEQLRISMKNNPKKVKDTVQIVQHNIAKALENRMKQVSVEEESFLLVCTILDPRFKDRVFNCEQQKMAKEKLLSTLKESLACGKQLQSEDIDEEPPSKAPKLCGASGLLQELVMKRCSNKKFRHDDAFDFILTEVDTYLNQELVDMNSNILDYWKVSPFLNLKVLVCKYLCVPPSSIESERVFSGINNIYDNKRYSLSGEHAHQQLFLRYLYSKDSEGIDSIH